MIKLLVLLDGRKRSFSSFPYLNAVFLFKTVKQMTLYTTSVLCLDYMLNLPLVFPNRNKIVQCPLENRHGYAGLALKTLKYIDVEIWKKRKKSKETFLLQRLVVEERPALRCHSVRYLSLTQAPWSPLRGGGEKPAYSSTLFICSSLKEEEELSSVDLSPLPKKC